MVPVPGKGKEGKTGSGLVAVLFLENKNVEQEGVTENNIRGLVITIIDSMGETQKK